MDLNFPDLQAALEIITKTVGAEIHRLRENAGLTREKMVARMASDIHAQTLATYEKGTRQCTMQRFVEICMTLDASAPDVLAMALLRAEIDLRMIDIQVDLNAILLDKRAETKPLRGWARKRREAHPDRSSVVTVNRSALLELAVVLDYHEDEFTNYLKDFLAKPAARQA